MNWIFIKVLMWAAIMSSCKSECTYHVNDERITSSCEFESTLSFYHIRVDSVDDKGVPREYEEIRVIRIIPASEGNYSDVIYFNKSNSNYDFVDIDKGRSADKLQITIEKGEWYLIRGLDYFGSKSTYRIFFKRDSNGKLIVKHDTVSNW